MKLAYTQSTTATVERFNFGYTDLIYLEKTIVTKDNSKPHNTYVVLADTSKFSDLKYISAGGNQEVDNLKPIFAKKYTDLSCIDALDSLLQGYPYNDEGFRQKLWKPVTLFDYINGNEANIICQGSLKEFEDESVFDNYNVYFLSRYSNSVYDFNGDPIPMMMSYDYLNSIFESNYNKILKQLMEKIKVHPWCRNPEDIEIVTVPYYNNEDGRRKTFKNLYLLPSRKDFKDIYDNLLTEKPKYMSSEVDRVVGHVLYKKYDYLGITDILNQNAELEADN
jgi:hypothetical protein